MNGMRLGGLIRKESVQIFRDPSALAIAFALPLFLLLLFGYGVSLNAEHVPIGVVAEHPNPQTSSFVGTLHPPATSTSIRCRPSPTRKKRWREGKSTASSGCATISRAGPWAQAAHDRRRGQRGRRQHRAAGSGLCHPVLADLACATARGAGRGAGVSGGPADAHLVQSGAAQPRLSGAGLIAVIMTLIGALLTALVVAREWERGTMEALMASPVTMAEILIGKLLPYFVLGMGGMALSVLLAVTLFGVPLRGSLLVLTLASALFLLVALGMGDFQCARGISRAHPLREGRRRYPRLLRLPHARHVRRRDEPVRGSRHLPGVVRAAEQLARGHPHPSGGPDGRPAA